MILPQVDVGHSGEISDSIEHAEHVDYTKSKPLSVSTPDFDIDVADFRVTIAMKSNHASVAAARAVVEPFLRAWELDAALRYGPRSLAFEYERGYLIDRQPTPGVHAMIAEPISMTLSVGAVKMVLGLSAFPAAPMDIARDPTVDLMYARYVLYRDGRTTLADATNYCLTAIELAAASSQWSRKAAAKMLSVDFNVLSTMGRLSATKGGLHARKASGAGDEFSPAEHQWLEQIMVALIRRMAEVACDPAHPARRSS